MSAGCMGIGTGSGRSRDVGRAARATGIGLSNAPRVRARAVTRRMRQASRASGL
ncbi:hypothetical protein C7S14_6348 [Burkholderia cepacia]|nr:hypothetical protein C7S14_6348 [Burkholderia cepacia]